MQIDLTNNEIMVLSLALTYYLDEEEGNGTLGEMIEGGFTDDDITEIIEDLLIKIYPH